LFDLGEAYEEVKPSEARRRLLADLNLKLSPEELKRYEDESRADDRRYRRGRPELP
jgi:hypothetical protein